MPKLIIKKGNHLFKIDDYLEKEFVELKVETLGNIYFDNCIFVKYDFSLVEDILKGISALPFYLYL